MKIVNGRARSKEITDGHMSGKTLTHMRDVAYGHRTRMEIAKVMERAERMRDDEGLLTAAEQKRLRKAEKRRTV